MNNIDNGHCPEINWHFLHSLNVNEQTSIIAQKW